MSKIRTYQNPSSADISPKLFILTCPKEDKTSFLMFYELMNDFIKSELESKPEVFEVSKIAIYS